MYRYSLLTTPPNLWDGVYTPVPLNLRLAIALAFISEIWADMKCPEDFNMLVWFC